jgi:uncharacterized Zn-binding protein involved in type VI secretion
VHESPRSVGLGHPAGGTAALLGAARERTLDHKPLAVVGSTGFNAPPHAGIVDGAFATATGQIGQVMSGSSTVLVNQKPAATGQSTTRMCVAPGSLVPTVRDVFIGG